MSGAVRSCASACSSIECASARYFVSCSCRSRSISTLLVGVEGVSPPKRPLLFRLDPRPAAHPPDPRPRRRAPRAGRADLGGGRDGPPPYSLAEGLAAASSRQPGLAA